MSLRVGGSAGGAERFEAQYNGCDTVVKEDSVASLLIRVAQEDRAAFRALYRATSDALFGVLNRILRNRADAEEGLQEVFARVWVRAAGFNANRGSGMTWLITIARNYAIDQRRLRRVTEQDDVEVDTLADPQPGPDAYLSARSDVRRIVTCLNRLDPQHAQAVKAAYLNGMSYDELARTYAVPLNTMRTWLRRSLRKLRDCVAEA
jgi:RNA polymerase sigma-70 factor, ECF subfamily